MRGRYGRTGSTVLGQLWEAGLGLGLVVEAEAVADSELVAGLWARD